MAVYLLTFLLAFFVTYLTTPVVKILASRFNALDIPNDRKVHSEPIPRLGGLAIYIGFMAAVISAFFFADFTGIVIDPRNIIGIIIGASFLVAVGIYDDIKGLRPTLKLIGQIAAALVVIYFGVEITFISNPLNGLWPIGVFAIPLTLLWIVGITNAINMIDGLDGLATGVTAISAITLFFVAIRTHQIGAAILMLALGAAALGFLRFNFAPAKIFLGDSGSMFLGFILASSSIIGVLKTTLVVALVIPVLILGVPIFDTLFAIGRRLRSGKHPFEADKKHIHHMLLRAGFNTREAVLSIYIACFVLSFIALIMALQK
ncbi:MAG: MraY family glycosyltransferase [Candidatus Margulisiibacteriota bacterium]|nr:MraY family glycosyltransferase [Candidatus Margulisiibacteriota bacterium]